MYCKYCGKEISGDTRFCPHCGKELQVTMPAAPKGADVAAETTEPLSIPRTGDSSSVQVAGTATKKKTFEKFKLIFGIVAVIGIILLVTQLKGKAPIQRVKTSYFSTDNTHLVEDVIATAFSVEKSDIQWDAGQMEDSENFMVEAYTNDGKNRAQFVFLSDEIYQLQYLELDGYIPEYSDEVAGLIYAAKCMAPTTEKTPSKPVWDILVEIFKGGNDTIPPAPGFGEYAPLINETFASAANYGCYRPKLYQMVYDENNYSVTYNEFEAITEYGYEVYAAQYWANLPMFTELAGWIENYNNTQILPDFQGSWGDSYSQRCNMTITEEGEDFYYIEIHWSSSSTESTGWFITAYRDEQTGELYYQDGVRRDYVYPDNGDMMESVAYVDGAGKFYFNDDGYLCWLDEKEHIGDSCLFEKFE